MLAGCSSARALLKLHRERGASALPGCRPLRCQTQAALDKLKTKSEGGGKLVYEGRLCCDLILWQSGLKLGRVESLYSRQLIQFLFSFPEENQPICPECSVNYVSL